MSAPHGPLSKAEARLLIDRILESPDGVVWTHHCRTRGHGRNFDNYDVRRVLEHGMVCAKAWDDKHRNWTYSVSGIDMEGDPLTLIVVIDNANMLIKLITGHD